MPRIRTCRGKRFLANAGFPKEETERPFSGRSQPANFLHVMFIARYLYSGSSYHRSVTFTLPIDYTGGAAILKESRLGPQSSQLKRSLIIHVVGL